VALTSLVVDARPAQVFAVLSDGWNYADWVVGAVHIRAVDPHWPAVGAQVHHKVGAWPAMIADATEVTGCDPGGQLSLRAGVWPLGEASVQVNWRAVSDSRTLVTMVEDLTAGPMLAARNKLNDLVLHFRNKESLRRLADMTRRYPDATLP
jgi:hypothetical protein